MGVWILCTVVLSLNFLMADEKTTAAKRCWVVNVAGLNHTIYFKMS